MRYREAKNLESGNQVIRKSDKTKLIVKSLEILGQFKLVRVHCETVGGEKISLYNSEIE